jgi:cation-transporting ATPase E
VVGDGVDDLTALQQANLAICRHSSSQAALSLADIVLLGTSPKVLLDVLDRGQRIVHRLLDVLKLNLARVLYVALLIFAIRGLDAGFPYLGGQGSAVSIITVSFPSLALAFWAPGGVVLSKRFGPTRAQCAAPAALTRGRTALLVYLHFLERTGSIVYAQLALTYTLIYSGLLLAVLVNPPWRSRRGERDEPRAVDWRMVKLGLVLGIIALILPGIPAARELFKLDWLQRPADYGVIALAFVAWAVILSLIWRVLESDNLGRRPARWGES